MNAPRLIAVLPAVANLACGCCFHMDMTKSAQVRDSGVLGQGFRTTEQLDLIKDTHTRTLFLAKRDYPVSSRDKRVGVIEASTELRVNRVERVKELIAILLFLPEYFSWDCTLAKIQGGPYAGKEVAVAGEGLLYTKDPATNGSAMLISTKKDNQLPEPSAVHAGSSSR